MSFVALPCDNERHWRRLLQLFSHISSCRDVYSLQTALTDVAAAANRAGRAKIEVSGLEIFFNQYADAEESSRFFESTLPFITKLAACLKQEVGETTVGIPVKTGEYDTSLKRSVIACLLACGVLCAFPAHRGVGGLNFVKFYDCFNNSKLDRCRSQSAKFRCIIHYFERLSERGLENICGHVTYSRRVLSSIPTLDWWTKCVLPLCTVKVIEDAAIEDAAEETLQVDFAARHIGGGVLATGRVQEEIRFCINPELIASMLFMDVMESNEAIVIRGIERFSSYSGYGQTLKFAGDYQDKSKRDQAGDLMTCIVAIDAVNVNNLHGTSQYSMDVILRDLVKAYAGFHASQPDLALPIMSNHSSAIHQEITEYADQLVTNVFDSVECALKQSGTSRLHQQMQSQSLSDFADLQVGAIMESVKEMILDGRLPTSSSSDCSSSLVAGFTVSAPESAYIEQLRSTTANMSVDQYADRLVCSAVSSGLKEYASSEHNQTLDEWASEFAESILQSTLGTETTRADRSCGSGSQVSYDVASQGNGPSGQYRAVATGNWGCGAFGGDPQLKSLIQWMAISAAGRPAMHYYPYHNKQVEQDVANHVTCKQWTVGDMMKVLVEYSQRYHSDKKAKGKHVSMDLFDYIRSL